jgi:hypothetical protein
MNYQQLKKQNMDGTDGGIANPILRLSDNAYIPFAPDNTDYQTFKKEVLAGAELQDAEGVVMTQEQANAFIKELP